VKGLLRDAAHEMLPFDPEIREEVVHAVFGHQAGSMGGKDGTGTGFFRSHGGRCHFSNAELPALERMEVAGPLSSHLYDTIASTSMDANTGTASPQTLRTIEVCVPLALEGHIDCEGEEDLKVLVKCLSWVRSIGAHRNRGLGRCRITVKTASS
jgi:CRISPR/Cas system CSM-associated protein Csm3 (group 7 of RAMP superfamily)